MNLYLVRHGKANTSPNGEHILTKIGEEETRAMAHLLKEKEVEIDEILHSPKKRAQQTAQIIGQIVAPDVALIQKSTLNPDEPIEPFFAEIEPLDRNLLIVSHLPFLEKLIASLTNSIVDFACSSIVCLKETSSSFKVNWILSP
jgi:phosphohistidine phosphatase